MENQPPLIVTRLELYQRVWNTPVFRLAREFGISDVALAKLCRRRAIPIPPRGYWARLGAGQPVERPRLPPGTPTTDRPVIFKRGAKPLEDHAPQRAPSRASRAAVFNGRTHQADSSQLHPIADRVRKSLLLSKPSACGRVRVEQKGLPLVVASPKQATKVAELVHALVSEARRKQIELFPAEAASNPLEFCRGTNRVQVCIEEELRPQSLTQEGRPLVPSGRLIFQLAVQWKQTADVPVESLVDTLVAEMDEFLR